MSTLSSNQVDKKYSRLIAIVSVLIPIVVAVLLFVPAKLSLSAEWVYLLPKINAVINSLTSVLLILGFIFIKKKMINQHRAVMSSAFVLGALFLVSYVVYHASAPSTSFGGEGAIRTIYYVVLLSHILLAAIVVPFVLFAFYFALTQKIEKHKKIVKWTFPIWLYVSVTGVIVYLMISPYYSF
ncbi:DUF420 domain-containing protein [Penaeicola halotolerans]|uniref:DUF420 domain-containing protein n=1 Tax=Penaeicola halotolerans TaxID=2793196 RepID=UPI001CF84239|nr:DUF420 domain-containing protein [Penaeicola halotolerans]